MAFDRQNVHEPVRHAGVRGGGRVWASSIAVIRGECCETSPGICDRAVIEADNEQEIVGGSGGDGAASERKACADGRTTGLDRSCWINICIFELIEMEGTGGSSGQRDGEGDRSAAASNIFSVEGLPTLRGTVPVGRSEGRCIHISFVIGDGRNGERLVAPFYCNGDEIPCDASGGKCLRDRSGSREHGSFGLLDEGDGRRRSRRLGRGGGDVRKTARVAGAVKRAHLVAVRSGREQAGVREARRSGSSNLGKCGAACKLATLDLILRDADVVGGSGPRKIDLRTASGGGRQVGRRRWRRGVRKRSGVRHIGVAGVTGAIGGAHSVEECRERSEWDVGINGDRCGSRTDLREGYAIRRAFHFEAGLIGRIIRPRKIDLRGTERCSSQSRRSGGRTCKCRGGCDVGGQAGIARSVGGDDFVAVTRGDQKAGIGKRGGSTGGGCDLGEACTTSALAALDFVSGYGNVVR